MIEFNLAHNKNVPSGTRCVYKITIGDYFYYGSTTDFNKRVLYYISNLSRRTVLLNKKMKAVAKKHSYGEMVIVFSCENMSEVKEIEDFFIKSKCDDPKNMNRTKSAYNNYGTTKHIHREF